MYELTITREFCAAHSLVIHGTREPVHGHNWRVQIVVAGESLDEDGLLVDFHLLERRLDAIIQPLNNADLNSLEPFRKNNPTAERVAEYIGETMLVELPERVNLVATSVTEAPGCIATYRP